MRPSRVKREVSLVFRGRRGEERWEEERRREDKRREVWWGKERLEKERRREDWRGWEKERWVEERRMKDKHKQFSVISKSLRRPQSEKRSYNLGYNYS